MGVVDNGEIPSTSPPHFISTVEIAVFDELVVISAINKLKPNLSSGPDSLPSLLSKHLK